MKCAEIEAMRVALHPFLPTFLSTEAVPRLGIRRVLSQRDCERRSFGAGRGVKDKGKHREALYSVLQPCAYLTYLNNFHKI